MHVHTHVHVHVDVHISAHAHTYACACACAWCMPPSRLTSIGCDQTPTKWCQAKRGSSGVRPNADQVVSGQTPIKWCQAKRRSSGVRPNDLGDLGVRKGAQAARYRPTLTQDHSRSLEITRGHSPAEIASVASSPRPPGRPAARTARQIGVQSFTRTRARSPPPSPRSPVTSASVSCRARDPE